MQYPGLLNVGAFKRADPSNDDLLIISRQVSTTNRKRADLFAIDREGFLIVIEVKRDAVDERGRVEGLEFQAIRYAAASRKMTVQAVIDIFADYLRKQAGGPAAPGEIDLNWKRQAIDQLCKHLADEDVALDESDLSDYINPKEKQKIYLVAADYEREGTSACAWLREHQIDISCFRLQPYRIADQVVVVRERLIPPPELGDFMTDIAAPAAASSATQYKAGPKAPSNKPIGMVWSEDPEQSISLSSWRGLLMQVVPWALAHGLQPEQLPVRSCADKRQANDEFRAPVLLEAHNLWIEVHNNAAGIRTAVQSMVEQVGNVGLRVETRNGEVIEFGTWAR